MNKFKIGDKVSVYLSAADIDGMIIVDLKNGRYTVQLENFEVRPEELTLRSK